MNIENIYSVNHLKETTSLQKDIAFKLDIGTVFKAQILDINQNEILLKLLDKNVTVKAQALNLIDKKVGQVLDFKVKENINGQTFIEIISNEKQTNPKDVVKDILQNSNLKENDENINFIQNLLEFDLPIDKESLQKYTSFLKSNNNLNKNNLVFMLANNIKIDEKSINQLNQYIDGKVSLKSQLESLTTEVLNLNDEDLIQKFQQIFINDDKLDLNSKYNNTPIKNVIEKIGEEKFNNIEQSLLQNKSKYDIKNLNKMSNQELNEFIENDMTLKQIGHVDNIKDFIKQIFSNNDNIVFESNYIQKDNNKNNIINLFLQKNFIKLDKENLEKLPDFFNELNKKVSGFKSFIASQEGKKLDNIMDKLSDIQGNLEFLDKVSNYQTYVQIPLIKQNDTYQTDLYVFKDKQNKNSSKNNISALLCLELSNLGYTEIYVQKKEKNIYFQFKLENETAKDIIKEKIINLKNNLYKKGYIVEGILFKELKEPFNVVKNLKDYDEKQKDTKIKRYSFDMRI